MGAPMIVSEYPATTEAQQELYEQMMFDAKFPLKVVSQASAGEDMPVLAPMWSGDLLRATVASK